MSEAMGISHMRRRGQGGTQGVPEGSGLGNVGAVAPRRSGEADRMFSAFAGWCWRQHLGFQPAGECREKRTFLLLTNNQPINKQAALLT